jgi:formylmethanofuran dehydrogenase subunit A
MIFRENKTHFVDRVNWRTVKFKKVVADSRTIKAAYKVIIDGKVVGAIGELASKTSHRGNWVWVKTHESFSKTFRYDDATFSRKWAAAYLIRALFPSSV